VQAYHGPSAATTYDRRRRHKHKYGHKGWRDAGKRITQVWQCPLHINRGVKRQGHKGL